MTSKKNEESKPQFDYQIDCKREMIHPRTNKPMPLEAEGKEMLTLGFVIGALLTEEKHAEFSPMKAWAIGQKFYSISQVGMDAADFGNLKKALESTDRWLPFVVGQAMEYLESLKRE